MNKLFISFEDIHKLIKKIASDIKNDLWEPDCIVAIAAGGFIPARILRNFIKKDIYVVGIKRYSEEKIIHNPPKKIQWLDEVEKKLKNKKILLVDEIDDTRATLSYCTKELLTHNPKEIRVAVIHQKLKEKSADFPLSVKKIYYGNEIPDFWVIYPWDTEDIEKHNKCCRN